MDFHSQITAVIRFLGCAAPLFAAGAQLDSCGLQPESQTDAQRVQLGDFSITVPPGWQVGVRTRRKGVEGVVLWRAGENGASVLFWRWEAAGSRGKQRPKSGGPGYSRYKEQRTQFLRMPATVTSYSFVGRRTKLDEANPHDAKMLVFARGDTRYGLEVSVPRIGLAPSSPRQISALWTQFKNSLREEWAKRE